MTMLHLLQVLGCSVWMDLRNRAIHFALFTTVFGLKFNNFFLPPTKNWCYHDNSKVATRTNCIFRQPPTISFPTLLDCYRELLWSTSYLPILNPPSPFTEFTPFLSCPTTHYGPPPWASRGSAIYVFIVIGYEAGSLQQQTYFWSSLLSLLHYFLEGE